jgi:hypothetical protein
MGIERLRFVDAKLPKKKYGRFLKLTPQMKEAIRRTVKLNEVVSGRDK